MARAYYNENDPFASEWLKWLIALGIIANGDVDQRSIEDVCPADLKGYTQCHFFAGIGGWSYAARLGGWSDNRPLWTGSCPCQPFSAAGKGGGFADERHLWPHFHWLIANCRPVTIMGEQVASKDGLKWFDLVQADLENTAYITGALDLCAASIGAPHIRQRLYWRADSKYTERWTECKEQQQSYGRDGFRGSGEPGVSSDSSSGLTGNSHLQRSGQYRLQSQISSASVNPDSHFSTAERWRFDMGKTQGVAQNSSQEREWIRVNTGPSFLINDSLQSNATRLEGHGEHESNRGKSGWLSAERTRLAAETGATRGYWADCDWWHGKDEKYRPIEPGIFPLVNGVSGRVGKLRGFGNAIVAELAAEFIRITEEA